MTTTHWPTESSTRLDGRPGDLDRRELDVNDPRRRNVSRKTGSATLPLPAPHRVPEPLPMEGIPFS